MQSENDLLIAIIMYVYIHLYITHHMLNQLHYKIGLHLLHGALLQLALLHARDRCCSDSGDV